MTPNINFVICHVLQLENRDARELTPYKCQKNEYWCRNTKILPQTHYLFKKYWSSFKNKFSELYKNQLKPEKPSERNND